MGVVGGATLSGAKRECSLWAVLILGETGRRALPEVRHFVFENITLTFFQLFSHFIFLPKEF